MYSTIENQLFNSTIYTIVLYYINIIGAITISIAPAYFYILLTQSGSLKRFKWFLLNHSFWCLSFLISFIIFKPVLLLPAPCGFQNSIFRNTSMGASVVGLGIVFGLGIMSVGGVCTSIIYRYFGLFNGIIEMICHSIPMYIFTIFVHCVALIILFICTAAIAGTSQESMIEQAIEFDPELEPFTHEKTFMFVSETIYKTGAIMILAIIICFIILLLVLVYLLQNKLVSKLRNEHQRNLIMSVIVQLTVTVTLQFCPFCFLFLSMVLKIPNSGVIMEFMELLIASHTFVEYCITLYFVSPYRNYISEKLDKLKEILKDLISIKDLKLRKLQLKNIVPFSICAPQRTSDISQYIA